MFEDTAEARLRCSSISLENGADEAWLNGAPIDLCDEGMSFPSRWQFDPGTTLAMTLELCCGGKKARAEGVVVGCEPIGERLWSVTLMFLDAPVGLQEFKDSNLEIRGEVGGGLLT
jgi:hypothetical protein